jgi:hypothetical protein
VTIRLFAFIFRKERVAVARHDTNPNREAIMSRSETLLPLLLPLSLAACGVSHTPVPMVGAATDVSALIGQWSGDYSSAESGRSGSISFTLRAAGDSAFGDVVMVPSASGIPLRPWHTQETGPASTDGRQSSAAIDGVDDPIRARERATSAERWTPMPIRKRGRGSSPRLAVSSEATA